MENKKLKETRIRWKSHPSINKYYYFNGEDGIVLLRLNNFPEEPLLTLINGFDIEDIDERPNMWDFELSE